MDKSEFPTLYPSYQVLISESSHFISKYSRASSNFLSQILLNSASSASFKLSLINSNSLKSELIKLFKLNNHSSQDLFLILFKEMKITGYCPCSLKYMDFSISKLENNFLFSSA